MSVALADVWSSLCAEQPDHLQLPGAFFHYFTSSFKHSCRSSQHRARTFCSTSTPMAPCSPSTWATSMTACIFSELILLNVLLFFSWNDKGPGSVQNATYVWLPIEVVTFRIHRSSAHANPSFAYQNLDTTPTMVFHETWAIADY